MRHIAIIGSGPAGYYTAEAAQKLWGDDVRVDIFDMLPVPYGLIRTGVAPDHQSIKAVYRRYEATVAVGQCPLCRQCHGRQRHFDCRAAGRSMTRWCSPPARRMTRRSACPAKTWAMSSAAPLSSAGTTATPISPISIPDFSGKNAVVIGNGNVALDVARILAKTRDEFAGSDIVAHALDALEAAKTEQITILGRRGPHQIAMTPKELGELGHLERACPRRRSRRSARGRRGRAARARPAQIGHPSAQLRRDSRGAPRRQGHRPRVRFLRRAQGDSGRWTGSTGVEVERTRLDGGRAVGTGETYVVPADLVVICIGYQTSPIAGVPFEESAGRFANVDGRILPGLYCVGWARRGPSGTIGTNKPDGFSIIERIAEDIASGARGSRKQGGAGFDALAEGARAQCRQLQRLEEDRGSRNAAPAKARRARNSCGWRR